MQSTTEIRDRITITKFSVQNSDGTSYNQTMFNPSDIEDINRMKESITQAAIKAGRTPPEFVLSVILIPNWKEEGNSYNDEQYLETQARFMQQVHHDYGDVVDTIHDFARQTLLAEEESNYMHGLGIPGVGGLGSVADMLKTLSIYDNADRRHLNIDSNTKIVDYEAFYNATFNAKEQQLFVNASYYDPRYVSTHNKIVYTPQNSHEAILFGDELYRHCVAHQFDAQDKKKNSIYSKAFVKAASSLGLSEEVTLREVDIETQLTREKICYKANMDHPAYSMSQHVVTAINMSWAPSGSGANLDHLKKISAIIVGDAKVDFQAFQYIVKKNTQQMKFKGSRTQLLALSNMNNDDYIVNAFFFHTATSNPGKVLDLARMIPDTKEGNQFCQRVFECSVNDLHAYAERFHKSLAGIEQRLAMHGEALEALDKKLTKLSRELDSLGERLELLTERLEELSARIEQASRRLETGHISEPSVGINSFFHHSVSSDGKTGKPGVANSYGY